MPVILGLDAAWTASQPSGISVVRGGAGGWQLIAVSVGYPTFYAAAGLGTQDTGFNAPFLLEAAARIAGGPVGLVAADIPLAHSPIKGRRESDNAVSRAYGARHAGTHTPSASRPGALADAMRADFLSAGFPLQTRAPTMSGLIEVYPHPATIELMAAPRRLEYKVGKTTKYWPGLSITERRRRLLAQWRLIVERLDHCIDGVARLLPAPAIDASTRVLKAYEDALDAVVCAWIGICVIEGRALAMGDDDSAIWVPMAGKY